MNYILTYAQVTENCVPKTLFIIQLALFNNSFHNEEHFLKLRTSCVTFSSRGTDFQ